MWSTSAAPSESRQPLRLLGIFRELDHPLVTPAGFAFWDAIDPSAEKVNFALGSS
jgi:hypothetical protein